MFLSARLVTAEVDGAEYADQTRLLGIGLSDGTGIAGASWRDDNLDVSNIIEWRENDECLVFLNGAGSGNKEAEANYVSSDSDGDGFIINWTDAPPAAYEIDYLAISEDIIADYHLFPMQYDVFALTLGTEAFTGFGFQPDAALFFGFGGTNEGAAGRAGFNLGAARSPTMRGSAGHSQRDALGTTNVSKGGSDQRAYNHLAFAGFHGAFDLESFDADGLTINQTEALGNAANAGVVYGLALKFAAGADMSVYAELTPTTATTVARTDLGFTPEALFAFSHGSVPITAGTGIGTEDERNNVAFADATSYGVIVGTGIDAGTFSREKRRHDRSHFILLPNAATGATLESATVALDADGYTLDFDAANEFQREIIVVAFGVTASEETTGQIKVHDGSSFTPKPVKVYNGSSWETKPLKIYNSSSWEETSY